MTIQRTNNNIKYKIKSISFYFINQYSYESIVKKRIINTPIYLKLPSFIKMYS